LSNHSQKNTQIKQNNNETKKLTKSISPIQGKETKSGKNSNRKERELSPKNGG